MPNAQISQITVPVDVSGVLTPTTFDIKDAGARELISALGNAVKWVGVTTTALEDGSTTSTITIGGESHSAEVGDMAQYNGEEFVWNGSAWQSIGKNNFGDFAFVDSVSYTPEGSVSAPTISVTGDSTGTVNSITDVGTLPTFSVSGEVLTFTAGTLPTKGSDTTVVTATGTISASAPTFTGTAATIAPSS
jgi:hypothetical protein